MIRGTVHRFSESELIDFLDGRADEALSTRITEALGEDPMLETRLRALDGGLPEVRAALDVVASRAPATTLARALASATAEYTVRQSARTGVATPTWLVVGALAIVLAFAGGVWVGMAGDPRPVLDPAPMSDRPTPGSPAPARAMPAAEPATPAKPPLTDDTTSGAPVASGPATNPAPVASAPDATPQPVAPVIAEAPPAPAATTADATEPTTTPQPLAPVIAEAQPAPSATTADATAPTATPQPLAPEIAEAQPAPAATTADATAPTATPQPLAPVIAEAPPATSATTADATAPTATPQPVAPVIAEAPPAPAAATADAKEPQREVAPWVVAVANYVRLMTTETLAQTAQTQRRQRSELAVMSQRFGVDLAALVRSVPSFKLQRIERLELNGRPLLQLAFVDRDGSPAAICILLRATPAKSAPPGPPPPVFRESTSEGLNAVHWDRQPRGFLVIGRGALDELRTMAERIDRDL